MAFNLQPGLILGGNLTLSPTGTPFIKDANWSKASTKPILVGVVNNIAFASTSKYDADGSTVTGGTTIGGGVSSTTRWSSPLVIGVVNNIAFASTSKYDADGSTVTGGTTIGGGASTTTRWSSPLEIGVTTNIAFASTSKYDADGSTVTGGTTIGGGTSTTTRWSAPLAIGVANNIAFASTSKYNADGSTVTGGTTIGGGTSTTNASSELVAKYYVVTAYRGDDGASNAGGAYVFDANDPSATPTKLLSPDPYQNQFVGMASAASSNHIVLGTWRDDGGNSGDYSKGAAYVYDVNDLTATPTKLTAFDGQGGDRFGKSVAASSDKIYVGASDVNNQGTSTTDGAVYVYDANDLSATPTRIDPFDVQTYPGKNFGVSVDVNSDHLFVGAYWGTTPTDSKMGAVYVYDVNDLSATPTKLTAFDDNPDDNARFGQYLSASSDHLVVGSHSDYINLTGDPQKSGTAYVYDLSDLSAQPTKIGPFDANTNDQFGTSIAVSSSYVVIGSKMDDDGGSSTGSVYVYDLSDLSATPTKITEPSPEQFAEFSKVAVLSDKLIIGAGQGGGVLSGTDTGTAYVYDLNDLSAAPTQLLAGDGQQGDYFGESVSIVPAPTPVSVDWSAPLTIGVATNIAFASTSKYDD